MKVVTIIKSPPIRKGVVKSPPKPKYIAQASWTDDLIFQSKIIGEGLTLFVLFTSTMNWWHYKQMREHYENSDEEKKDSDVSKNKNKDIERID